MFSERLPPSMKRLDLLPIANQQEIIAYYQKQSKKPIDIWQPQPKQELLLELCGLREALTGGPVRPALAKYIGYGGAAGGGKTEGMIGACLIALATIPGVKIGYFRRKFTELEGSDGPIERSQVLFPQIGGDYNKGKHIWRFGDQKSDDWNEGEAAAFRFCHCQYESDVYQYQSSAFDIYCFDEATHFSWFQLRYLMTRNRISKYSAIPRPFAIMCSNPGGVGHAWYKKIFDIKDMIYAN